MHHRTTPKAFGHAKELRRNLMDAEQKLWQSIRYGQICGVRFRRQHAIGPYIADFCAPTKKLILEVDGGQHVEQQEYDADRTAYLAEKGYRVLRFWNHEVLKELDAVLEVIRLAVEE
jgi:very-short-patch-repair endonuclease